jgi:hypothetical protein
MLALCALLGLHAARTGVEAAQALAIVQVNLDVYCLFSPTCAVVRTTTQSTFVLPGQAGTGVLSTSTFTGAPGSAAEGFSGYEYRIDLSGVVGITGLNCVNSLRIKWGTPTFLLDYDGDGTTGERAYVVSSGAPGSVGPSLAVKEGPFVTFFFDPAVCPGAAPGEGDASFPIGMVTGAAPQGVLAELTPDFGGIVQVGARAPTPSPKLRFKDTLLYETVLALPPGALVGSTPQAQEGHRRAMLNEVSAALALADDGHELAAVQLLERLLARMDGAPPDWVQDDPGTREDERALLHELVQGVIQGLITEP